MDMRNMTTSPHPEVGPIHDDQLLVRRAKTQPRLRFRFDGTPEGRKLNFKHAQTLAIEKRKIAHHQVPYHQGPWTIGENDTRSVHEAVKEMKRSSVTGLVPLNVKKTMWLQGEEERTMVPPQWYELEGFQPEEGEILSGAIDRYVVDPVERSEKVYASFMAQNFLMRVAERPDRMARHVMMAAEMMVNGTFIQQERYKERTRPDPLVGYQIRKKEVSFIDVDCIDKNYSRKETFHKVIRVDPPRAAQRNAAIWEVTISAQVRSLLNYNEDTNVWLEELPVLEIEVHLVHREHYDGRSPYQLQLFRDQQEMSGGLASNRLKVLTRWKVKDLWNAIFFISSNGVGIRAWPKKA